MACLPPRSVPQPISKHAVVRHHALAYEKGELKVADLFPVGTDGRVRITFHAKISVCGVRLQVVLLFV